MAETKSFHELALPAKRKPDLSSQDQENRPLKSLKLQSVNETSQAKEGNHSADDRTLETSGNDDSFVPEPWLGNEELGVDAEEEDDDFGDDLEEEEEEDENGNAAVDWKGKGILIEEEKDSGEYDDDDDDSSDGGNETDGEVNDLSDDPLAELDLDNILPSRTRRRAAQPGVYIAKDIGNNGEGDDSDSSDS